MGENEKRKERKDRQLAVTLVVHTCTHCTFRDWYLNLGTSSNIVPPRTCLEAACLLSSGVNVDDNNGGADAPKRGDTNESIHQR